MTPPHVAMWNDTAADYPDDISIADLFAAHAKSDPERIAVTNGDQSLSYGELDEWSGRLAARLVEAGVAVGEPVGMLGDRCLEAPVAMLGILKAGAAYVPLARSDPAGRLRTLADELGIRRLVTLPGRAGVPIPLPVFPVEDFRTGAPAPAGGPQPTVRVRGSDRCYVMFTSGTTGVPKAVAVAHRSVARLVINTNYVQFTADDRVANTGHIAFDASVFEIWGALLNGARLVVVDPDTLLNPPRLVEFLRRERITVLWLSAGVFHHCARSRPDLLTGIRYAISGGDVLRPEVIREVLRVGPPGQLVNGYGPTENTTFSTTYQISDVPADANRIPIGRPIANSTCYILTDDGRPAGVGEEGELVVGGDGVALGYLNDPAGTAERFVPDPFARRPDARMYRTGDRARWLPDGTVDFLGRRDRMVKLRDFRIELDEIEAVLRTHPAVGEVAVTATGGDPAGRSLIGHYTPGRGDPPKPAELRAYLGERLPTYMLPGLFLRHERFPLTTSGKLDRDALDRDAAGAAHGGGLAGARHPAVAERARPHTPLQIGLAQLWSEVLDVDEVSLDDSFFELGGNSLLAARIFARLQTVFGIDPQQGRFLTGRLLADPTLRASAEAVSEARAGALRRDEEGRVIDFAREATLDVPLPADRWPQRAPGPPGEILLTGATGFVGTYLLRELLTTTEARIHCLVRALDPEHARRRLAASQLRYDLGTLPPDRVVPLVGDLSQPCLGLSEEEFDRYARRTDLVLHAGAYVNFTYPYSHLAPVTVHGTREVIRLAGRHRGIPVHFVSSVAVLAGFAGGGVREVTEDTPLAYPEHLYLGYSEAKWVAESLLQKAASAGLPVSILRPYEVTGDLRHGLWNLENATCALFRLMVDLGYAPDVDLPLDMVPVDLLAQQIVHIVLTRTAVSATYHLTNPRPALLRDMIAVLCDHGYRVTELPLADWVDEAVRFACEHPEHPFTPFVPLWVDRSPRSGLLVKEMYFKSRFPRFGRANAEAALAGAGIAPPPADADLLEHYVKSLRRVGFLPPPPTPADPVGSS